MSKTNHIPHSHGRTLINELNGHRNSLGAIRLVLASLVIVSHAYPLGGFGSDPLFRHFSAYDSIGGVAVVGFFGLSGFLVVRSGLHADVLQFLWRRILRIFPAFWGALCFAAFVVGPMVWWIGGKNLGSYFTFDAGGPFSYLLMNWNLSIGQYGILDIFATTTPYGGLVGGSVLNGSIWTLTYEWTCYVAVAILVFLGVLQKSRFTIVAITFILAALQLMNLVSPGATESFAPYLADPFVVSLGFVFSVGASIGIYADRIILNNRMGLASGVISAVSLFQGGWSFIGSITFPFFLLWLACSLPKIFQKIGQKNDYSYGVYVYGFLVQQTTAHFGVHNLGAYTWMLISLGGTLLLAILSWHILEKPAMKLKSIGPGRGINHWREKLNLTKAALQ